MSMKQSEFLRYQRHLPVIGTQGQLRLKQAKILCVGAGGLGCPALQYLAAAGIGTLGIIDSDKVDLSNLQRQILFQTSDIGRLKTEVAKERLLALNPEITINTYCEFFSDANASSLVNDYQIVLDASDNYQTRYLLNEVCRAQNTPLVSASIYQFDAQISVFNFHNGPCYQCLYPSPPPPALTPNCTLGGVLGVLPGVVGAMQATEAIKIVLEQGEILSGTLLSMDLLAMRFNQFTIDKQDCTQHPAIRFTNLSNKEPKSISPAELKALLSSGKEALKLIDVRQAYEREICHIGGQHIPLSELDQNLDQITDGQLTVIYCKSGARSAQACLKLEEAGFTRVMNLQGGILGWIEAVDDRLTVY
ncbi:putative adenylyltransferase/sulfurtransferase MoeZ [Legionella massiliensis]|uniref:Molybdopterin-synthase adenylyltransferase n=1 Tax=Legionella massiliensis TaxID=1034943 RepID=A0A078L0R2_9GAMM|nr:molybdopterin-synthase adenylyltransferase MoeB [Legionella massiliensis]CDZ77639.1 putative adenylyltransferase/sulfurtransferase MoeZ [Legionella massiliensis]CEE13377.1 putative adenylyltransferase/sulfurtransferase MoeZ [Legionella massiliensis]